MVECHSAYKRGLTIRHVNLQPIFRSRSLMFGPSSDNDQSAINDGLTTDDQGNGKMISIENRSRIQGKEETTADIPISHLFQL